MGAARSWWGGGSQPSENWRPGLSLQIWGELGIEEWRRMEMEPEAHLWEEPEELPEEPDFGVILGPLLRLIISGKG